MSTQFAHDLRLARKKAGYTQYDLSHLLSGHQSLVSDLERGKRRPSLEQIIELSLIYGRSFESHFAQVMTECRENLTARLESLPNPGRATAQTFNRNGSLSRLRQRLKQPSDHETA